MRKIKILVIGGNKQEIHDFAAMGPIFKDFLEKEGFKPTLTQDLDMFLPDNIKDFDVILCSTTGRELNSQQEKGLLNAIIGASWSNTGNPKGFIGVHGASCSFLSSEAYLRMLGGRFLTHPPLENAYNFVVQNVDHPIMKKIENFLMIDELYLLEIYPPLEILLSCDFNGFPRPIAWVKPYGLGRVFYLALGHGVEQIRSEVFKRIIINSVYWTISEKRN